MFWRAGRYGGLVGISKIGDLRLVFPHIGNSGGQCVPWPVPATICESNRCDLDRMVRRGLWSRLEMLRIEDGEGKGR